MWAAAATEHLASVKDRRRYVLIYLNSASYSESVAMWAMTGHRALVKDRPIYLEFTKL